MSLPRTSAGCSRTTPSSNTSPAEAAKKSRKRQRKFEEWKSTQQKAKRNRGESYVSKTGKLVSEFITQYGSTVYIGMALVWPAL